MNTHESKITYLEGGKIRTVRGIIIENNENEVTIARRDGKITIMKQHILKIEEPAKEVNHAGH